MTKKGHHIFGQEKCTPAEKILATSMADGPGKEMKQEYCVG